MPNSNEAMERANTRGSGVYGGPAMAGPGVISWRFPVSWPAHTHVSGGPIYGHSDSSPAVVAGKVYVGGEAYLYALDAVTGQEQWRFNTPGDDVNSPAVAGGTVFFGSFQSLYAVAAATGVERWHRAIHNDSDASFTNPVVAAGIVYVGSGQGAVYALDAATGDELWQVAVDGAVLYTPALADGRLFFAAEPRPPAYSGGSFFYAVDIQTGKVAWRTQLDGATSSAPAIGDGTVYITGIGLGLYALDIRTGQTLWQFHHGRSVIGDAPAVAYGTVFITVADTGLFALDAQNGAERWHFQRSEGFLVAPTIAGDVVYCPTLDGPVRAHQPGALYTVQAETGQQLGRIPVEGNVANQAVIVDGVVYLVSSDGYLYALR